MNTNGNQPVEPTDLLRIVYTPNDIARLTVRTVEERMENKGQGLTTGIATLDKILMPFFPGELIGVMARTSNYKTGFMQFLARQFAAQIDANESKNEMVVYVTWEVSIEELGFYDLAHMADVDASQVWQGNITPNGLEQIKTAAMHRAAQPIWTIGHSLARRRELRKLTLDKVRDALLEVEIHQDGFHPRAIFLDYLQEIDPIEGQDRRERMINNVEMAKQLARDLGCPVFIGVQAGRRVDERAFRLPQIGDGEECLTGETLLMDATTGMIHSVEEWYQGGVIPHIHTMSDGWRLGPAKPAWLKLSGIQDIYHLETRYGHRLRASANHPLLTPEGWKRMDEIAIGEWVAVARYLPTEGNKKLSVDEGLLLGLLLGDGSYTDGNTPSYCCGRDRELGQFAGRLAQNLFGTHPRESTHSTNGCWHVRFSGDVNAGPGVNHLITWLRGLKVYGQKHDNASVPEAVMCSSDDVVAAFLQGLATTDGSFPKPSKPDDVRVTIASVSRLFLEQVRLLLLRLGIPSHLRGQQPGPRSVQVCYHLNISSREYVERFMKRIGFIRECEKGRRIYGVWDALGQKQNSNLRSADLFPPKICLEAIEAVNEYGRASGMGQRETLNMVKGRAISRPRLRQVGEVTGRGDYTAMADGDVNWVEVKDIRPDGQEMTYDLCTPPTHNYVANGFIVHNTSRLEQAADKLIALWMPANNYAVGDELPEVGWPVSENLLVLGLRKQRLGKSSQILPLYVDPARNIIRPMDIHAVDLEPERDRSWKER